MANPELFVLFRVSNFSISLFTILHQALTQGSRCSAWYIISAARRLFDKVQKLFLCFATSNALLMSPGDVWPRCSWSKSLSTLAPSPNRMGGRKKGRADGSKDGWTEQRTGGGPWPWPKFRKAIGRTVPKNVATTVFHGGGGWPRPKASFKIVIKVWPYE